MRLESVLFPSANAERYERMARVLQLSAAENSPATPLNINRIYDTDDDVRKLARAGCKNTWIDNARKAKHHNRIIQEAAGGDVLGMIDSDTMILGDLSEVAAMDFDIAYTVRPPGAKWKINTGVYFVRVSSRTKAFVATWLGAVRRMLGDKQVHDYWRKDRCFGGIHQAALGSLIEPTDYAAATFRLLELPCAIWNCECNSIDMAKNPKVVHVMGRVREWCFGRTKPTTENARRLVGRWQQYDLARSGTATAAYGSQPLGACANRQAG